MALCQTGPANSEIDQEFWNNSGKVLGQPAYRLLSDPLTLRVDRGCFHERARTHEELAARRPQAVELRVTVFESGIPGYYEWVETTRSIMLTVGQVEPLRHGLVGRCLS